MIFAIAIYKYTIRKNACNCIVDVLACLSVFISQFLRRIAIMDLVKTLSEQYMKPELPPMNVGDTVRVTVRVKEGNRERNQAFEGTIIARKHGGVNETITVRRISYNVGCEKVFPIHSPTIVSVDTVRRGKVRRAKLYYLRDKIGKKAKVKERV